MARRRPQAPGRRGLRRRRLRRAVQGAPARRRRARRLPRPPHRPDRAPRGRPRRGRDGRRRRSRPHGRHGLPARGAGAARPHARRPARRCCSPPRSTARSTGSCSATRRDPSRHLLPEADQTAATHRFWSVDRARPRRRHRRDRRRRRPDHRVLPHQARRRRAGQEARAARRAQRGDPRQPLAGPA